MNDVDLAATEERIAEFANENASLIAANAEKSALESLTQAEREEIERIEREERRRVIEERDQFEKDEEERVKREIVRALVGFFVEVSLTGKASDSQHRANEIMANAARAKKAREAAYSVVIKPPPSVPTTNPLSPRYDGPFVPIPYNPPVSYPVRTYIDYRKDIRWLKETDKVRGGGWDLGIFYELEIRSAVESLGIEPLVA